jgi:hypothetical protein
MSAPQKADWFIVPDSADYSESHPIFKVIFGINCRKMQD